MSQQPHRGRFNPPCPLDGRLFQQKCRRLLPLPSSRSHKWLLRMSPFGVLCTSRLKKPPRQIHSRVLRVLYPTQGSGPHEAGMALVLPKPFLLLPFIHGYLHFEIPRSHFFLKFRMFPREGRDLTCFHLGAGPFRLSCLTRIEEGSGRDSCCIHKGIIN